MPITFGYRRIVEDIKARIESGELLPGARLPSTRMLMAEYGVGNTAVRNAMLVLKAEGYVEGHQGVAVFVKERPQET